MSAAIRIEQLSKVYKVDHEAPRGGRNYKTFREDLVSMLTSPLRAARRLASSRESGRNPRKEDFWALRDVSFDVAQGEVVGIIGRNGAGKSTLLKILSRIMPPSVGRIEINGRVGSLLEVGTGFHQELTGRENVFMNGSILGMSRNEIRRKFDAIVEFSGVERFLDTPVKRYSSGMQVRLAFAVAAHLDPEILLVDEVLAVGDFEFQKRCLGKMSEVAGSGRTILFVSHNLAAVEGLCTRGVVINKGCVSFIGTQKEALDHYLHLSASSAPFNRFEAVISSNERPKAARIVSAEVLGDGEFNGHGYPLGANLEFRINIKASERIERPVVIVGINSPVGDRIVTLHSELCAGEVFPERIDGECSVTCKTGVLPLIAGDYPVRIGLRDLRGEVDVIDHAMTLTILPSDFFGNGGRIPWGQIFTPQTWALSTAS